MEGFNGYVKDGAHEALDDAERRRVRGVAAQSVFVALLVFAANVRKIALVLKELSAMAVGKLRRLPRRRRTASIETWLPAASTGAIAGHDPPEPS